jgi:hypothetical protein
LEGDTYYALFGGHPYEIKPATLMKSRDLRHWEYVGPFMTREMPDVESDEGDAGCGEKLGQQDQ